MKLENPNTCRGYCRKQSYGIQKKRIDDAGDGLACAIDRFYRVIRRKTASKVGGDKSSGFFLQKTSNVSKPSELLVCQGCLILLAGA